ncbi:PucR family transcriptional regulator [Micromonospora sp. NBC_01813]|uniref:PucR family transcriptional regulator n=1 Tax=Micromonospora sp. NBC_01813 TaxID=2975988 RepID=UPI002DD7FC4F|nr:helix-turn-helix domain-containing protein [Micromonospora sp. NBC_01813]WSA09152.1 helix-turn-helix domain-containing protein [Micromonospora sp. NBC_01813]
MTGPAERPVAARPRLTVAAEPTPDQLARWLTDLAFDGAGWPVLLARLAEATGTGARLLAQTGELLASSDASGSGDRPDGASVAQGASAAELHAERVRCADGWTGRSVPVGAGGRRLGVLLLAEPVDAGQLDYGRAAVTALLIEAVRREPPQPPAPVGADAVLRALRDGTGVASAAGQADLVRAASGYGWRLDQPHAGVALGYTGSQHRRWASATTWLDRPVLADGWQGWTLLQGDAQREVARLRGRLEQIVGAGQVLVTCGRSVTGPAATSDSFRDARRLLRLLLHHPYGPPGLPAGPARAELPFDRSGLAQVLLAVPDERLRWYVDRHLGPIAERDDLLRTLDHWLASGGSRQAVSEQLHLHRNSVGYRVGLIKRLLGVDPLDPPTAAVLRAALVARELLITTPDVE